MSDISADTVTAPGAGGVARAMSTRVVESYYNLNDYGAVGDGAHDDTTALSSALSYARLNPGTIIYLPSANYLFNSLTSAGLNVPSYTTIRGAGQSRTNIKWNDNSAGTNLFRATGFPSDIVFEDFTITGSWLTVQAYNGSYPIMINSVTGLNVRNVTIQYSCAMGIVARACVNVVVEDCICRYVASDGISVSNCTNVLVAGNVVEHGHDDAISAHCSASPATGFPDDLEPWGVRKNITITGNRIFDAQGIKVLSARQCAIVGNQLDCVRAQGISVATVPVSQPPLFLSGPEGLAAGLNIVITGNSISNCIQRTHIDAANQGCAGIAISGDSTRSGIMNYIPTTGVSSVFVAGPGSFGTSGTYPLTFTGGGGTGATGTFTVSGGAITSTSMTSSGSGYTSAPTVSFLGAGLTGAQGSCVMAFGMGVAGISVMTAGTSGTNGTYPLSFSGGGGSGATGTFTVSGGAITSTSITNSGSGYTSTPSVSFPGAGLVGAAGSSVMSPSTGVSSIFMSSPGSLGTNGTYSLIFSGGGGSGAVGTFTVSGGAVTSTSITNSGAGYNSSPSVIFSNGPGLVGAVGICVMSAVSMGVSSISVSAAGSSGTAGTYPLSIMGGGGSGATGTFTVSGGAVTSTSITNPGSGYTWVPSVSFPGAGLVGAVGSCIVSFGMGVSSISVTAAGTSGTAGTYPLSISGGGGSGAAGTFTVSGGAVTSTSITSSGSGYGLAPFAALVSFPGAGLVGAQGSCIMAVGMGVAGISVMTAGTSGTNGTYPLSFSGGGGSGATGTFTVSGGAITSTLITSSGGGYTSTPSVNFLGAGLVGAAGSSVMSPSASVSSVFISSPGSSGTNGTYSLIFSGGGGSGAVGTFTVSGGAVTSTSIVSRGAGYTSAPSVSFSAVGLVGAGGACVMSTMNLGVLGISVTAAGTSGTAGTYPLSITGGGGSGATGTFTVSGGAITSTSITNPGSGYTSAPSVSFPGAGLVGAAGSCVMSGAAPLGTGIPGEPYQVGGVLTGVSDPYSYIFQNSLSSSAPTSGTFGITIVGNTIKRTLPACNGTSFNPNTGVAFNRFSDYGFGQIFTKHGWVDPSLAVSDLQDNAITIADGVVRDVLISNNTISGMVSGLALEGSGIRLDNIVFRDNNVTDCLNWGVLLVTTSLVRAYVYNNIFDLDPFLKHPNRGPNGTWQSSAGGSPSAFRVQTGSGVTFRGNTIRNCLSDSNASTDTPYLSNWIDGNIIEADPVVTGFSTLNKGVGTIRTSGNSLLVQSGNDPTQSTFGQMLTPPPNSAASMPTTGTFVAGHFIRNSGASVLGTPLQNVTIASKGTGGTNGTFALGFSGGGGSGAAGTFTVSAGSVTAVNLTDAGINYTSTSLTPLTISLSASSGLSGASVTASVGRVLFGWLRLTTGPSNTLNTDWSGLYAPAS